MEYITIITFIAVANLICATKFNKFKNRNSNEIDFFKSGNSSGLLADNFKAQHNEFLFYESFLNKQTINYSILIVITTIIFLISFVYRDKIIKAIESKFNLSNEFNFSYEKIVENVDYILSLGEIRDFLFTREGSYFKSKYGENFTIENSDIILVKKELLEILTSGNESNSIECINENKNIDHKIILNRNKIKEIIVENINLEKEKKLNLFFLMMRSILIIIFLFSIYKSIYSVKSPDYFSSVLLILIVFFGIFSFILLFFNKNGDEQENEKKESPFSKFPNEDLMVVERLLIK
jgi:hypothetical protein